MIWLESKDGKTIVIIKKSKNSDIQVEQQLGENDERLVLFKLI